VSNSGFTDPAEEGSVLPRHVAWVAWLDQFSSSLQDSFEVRLSGRTAATYRVLGLVPVQHALSPAPASRPVLSIQPGTAGEYPVGDDNLGWEGAGYGNTTSTAAIAGDDIVLTVRRADPANPAPICVLTDALNARVSHAAVMDTAISMGPIVDPTGDPTTGEDPYKPSSGKRSTDAQNAAVSGLPSSRDDHA
jgi:hypothetical protein